MRVRERLDHASTLSYIEKHPIVMPRAKDSKVSKLIITHYHEKCLHQGRGVTVNTIKSNGFWTLLLTSSVESVIYKCIKCRKLYRHRMERQMTILPHITANISTQHGYKTHHSTVTELHTVHKTVAKGFNQMAPLREQSLDMSKAFDTINIHTLIRKLLQTNIPGTIFKDLMRSKCNRELTLPG